jgi:hypothetical protein
MSTNKKSPRELFGTSDDFVEYIRKNCPTLVKGLQDVRFVEARSSLGREGNHEDLFSFFTDKFSFC